MAMSRRFYNNLAARLAAEEPRLSDYESAGIHAAAYKVWADSTLAAARAIQDEVPGFDIGRFVLAAGIEPAAAAALS